MMDGLHCTLQLVRENMNALIFLLIWRMLIQVPLIGKHYRSEAKYRIIKKLIIQSLTKIPFQPSITYLPDVAILLWKMLFFIKRMLYMAILIMKT